MATFYRSQSRPSIGTNAAWLLAHRVATAETRANAGPQCDRKFSTDAPDLCFQEPGAAGGEMMMGVGEIEGKPEFGIGCTAGGLENSGLEGTTGSCGIGAGEIGCGVSPVTSGLRGVTLKPVPSTFPLGEEVAPG